MKLKLVVVGVQKGGTTALHTLLASHPSLQPGTTKELHFFDDEEHVDWSNQDETRLNNFFPLYDDSKIQFDVTPIYIFWPNSMARIRRHNPDIKVIALFRDPIERAYSQWKMEVSRNTDSVSFSVAIREGRRRLDAVPVVHPAWRFWSYVERGFYGAQLAALLSNFARDQILLIESSQLKNQQADVCKRISAFLGISHFPPAEPVVEHVGAGGFGEMSDADRQLLRCAYQHDLPLFGELSGIDVTPWLDG